MTWFLVTTAKISVLVAAALAATLVGRRVSAAVRHYLLFAALVGAAAMPLAARFAPAWHLGFEAPASSIGASADTVVTVDVVVDDRAAPVARPPAPARAPLGTGASGWLLRAWIAGATVSVLILLAGFVRLKTLARRSKVVTSGPWRDALIDLAADARVRRPVRILQSDHPSFLVTWGSRAPTIVLPRGAASWPIDRIRVVLRHEIAHISRCDWAIQIVAELIRCAHWFNPIVWIACARMRQESEHACDDVVIGAGVNATDYASQLVEVARTMRGQRLLWLPAHGMARASRLEERVSAMLNARRNRAPITRTRRFATAGGVLALAILVAGFGSQAGTVFSGTVVDAMKRPLTNQSLTLTSAQSHENRQATTDSSGAFSFAPLPPGDYTLTIERFGFQKLEQPVTLAGSGVRQAITLKLGTIHETIRVTGAPPPAPPAAPTGKIGPPAAPPATPNWVELREKVRAKHANDPCATSTEGGCIQAPIKIRDTRPIYPESLKGSGIGGVVVLKGTVAADGAVHGLEVDSSPHPDLSSAAIAAVGQWLFEPTTLDGTVVDTPITIHIAFAATR